MNHTFLFSFHSQYATSTITFWTNLQSTKTDRQIYGENGDKQIDRANGDRQMKRIVIHQKIKIDMERMVIPTQINKNIFYLS